MEKKGNWLALLAESVRLEDEAFPGEPVVELAGDRRVLIEGHRGVIQYSREQICVKVGYGVVAISGNGLELRHMSREKLCIRGRIDSICLERKGRI